MKTKNSNFVGVALFLISESVFFLILILTFIYFRSYWWNGTASDPSTNLSPLTTGVFSIALLSSSGTAVFAERNRAKGDLKRTKIGLGLSILLGATFLIGQGVEFASLFKKQIVISNGLFGTTFFTLTGFHGLHVLVGLAMWSVLLGLSLAGGRRTPSTDGVSAVSLYWHFVDAVWVVIFSVIYIWTVLGR